MRSLATGTILLLLLSLVGSRPCSCEIRQKLAAATDKGEAESHSCCHASEPEPESEHEERHECIGCEACGAERDAVPGCGGQIVTAGIVDRDEPSPVFAPPVTVRSADTGRAPVSTRYDLLLVPPKSRRAVLSTVMIC